MGDHLNKAFGGTQYFVTKVVYPSLGTHVCFFYWNALSSGTYFENTMIIYHFLGNNSVFKRDNDKCMISSAYLTGSFLKN